MKKFFLFLLLITFSIAQPDTLWTKTFGGIYNDGAHSVLETADGGFLIVGTTILDSSNRAWIIRTDGEGNEIWNRVLDDYGGLSALQTSDGGFVILCAIRNTVNWNFDIRLLKTDPEGNEIWSRTYGGTDDDSGYSVIQTSDSGFVIVGITHSFGAGSCDVWLIRTDEDGNEVWDQTYGGGGCDSGRSVIQTIDGGFMIAGITHSFGVGGYDAWLIRTDGEGNEIWNQTYGSNESDDCYLIQQVTDGGFVIIGSLINTANFESDVWLLKTDPEGNEIWSRTYGGTDDDSGYSVLQTIDGGFVIVGRTLSFGIGGLDVWLVRTDEDGNEVWDQTYGGESHDYGESVIQASDGGYVVVGSTFSFGNGGQDVFLIRTDTEFGCLDTLSVNYNPDILFDDGSCYYLSDIAPYFSPIWSGFPISPMVIYIQSAIFDELDLRIGDEIGVYDGDQCVGSVQLTSEIDGSVEIYVSKDNPNTPEIDGYTPGNTILYRYWDASNQTEVFNVSSIVNSGSNVFAPTGFSNVDLSAITVLGCPYPIALNYLPDATVDDGSCIFPVYGCMDEEACNYDPEANVEGDCVYYDCAGICDGIAYEDECSVCDDLPENDNVCVGCSDPWAVNYLPIYTIDDGSCEYPDIGDISMDGIINVVDIVILVDVILNGDDYIFYMDFNYDDHINIVDIVILVDIILHPELLGCTYSWASNYDPNAIYDGGSCEYVTVTDIDGNIYNAVIIGEQVWMAENLRTIHYRNGDEIPTDYGNSEWSSLSIGAYAVYPWDYDYTSQNTCDENCADVYGNLYNWYAVNDTRDICPEGWHVPSDEEFMELEMHLGMSYEQAHATGFRGTNEGGKLKEVGYDHWLSPNTGATNESGFTAFPGGWRSPNYNYMGNSGHLWFSTEFNSNSSWHRQISFNSSNIYRDNWGKYSGLSVRCVRDSD